MLTVSAQGGEFAGFSLGHNVHSKAEVDEVIRQAVAVGAEMVKPPQEVFWGGYSGCLVLHLSGVWSGL